MSQTTQAQRNDYLQKAAQSIPPLFHRQVRPARCVRMVPDPAGLQGWRVEDLGPAAGTLGKPLKMAEPILLDMGEHVVGQIALTLGVTGTGADAPVRLRITCGEVPAEVSEKIDPYAGVLSRAWFQDEIIQLDILPGVLSISRRFAFQYLKIELLSTSLAFEPVLEDVVVTTQTSADGSRVKPLPDDVPADLRQMDQAACRTLANCMQTVFEDGPKRDRRLWMGDLRLQAMTNYATFGNMALVKRCLYLFGALTREDGIVNADVFEFPTPRRGVSSIYDYAALFPDTLLSYSQASGDWQTARDLWPVVMDQLPLLDCVDASGLFHDPGNWWLFIDWREGLDKQASIQAVLILMLRSMITLAEKLGPDHQKQVAHLPAMLDEMISAAREQLWDAKAGVFVSGVGGRNAADQSNVAGAARDVAHAADRQVQVAHRQVSWASQAWLTLAGVLSPADHAATLQKVMSDPSALKPAGPYLYHVVTQALFAAGLKDAAFELMRSYWGGMLSLGASTFWEVFDPADTRFSPFKNCLINSYCHAWSCTPAWFVRGVSN